MTTFEVTVGKHGQWLVKADSPKKAVEIAVRDAQPNMYAENILIIEVKKLEIEVISSDKGISLG